jgi:hypothetical protein
MEFVLKEYLVKTNYFTYINFLIHYGMEIWITKHLKVVMCLTYLVEKIVGWEKDNPEWHSKIKKLNT